MKTNKLIFGVSLTIFLLAAFNGCSHDSSDEVENETEEPEQTETVTEEAPSEENPVPELAFLGISDAKNLYIGPKKSSSRSARAADTEDVLYKITDDGAVEEVSCYSNEADSDGTSTMKIMEGVEVIPSQISSVSDDYIYIRFKISSGLYSGYLVRKSDGAVFNINEAGNVYDGVFRTDRYNNAYFRV